MPIQANSPGWKPEAEDDGGDGLRVAESESGEAWSLAVTLLCRLARYLITLHATV